MEVKQFRATQSRHVMSSESEMIKHAKPRTNNGMGHTRYFLISVP
jgi:hypothetical protein